MIQRKQTIYLLLALAALITCLCLPIGTISGSRLGTTGVVYNLGVFMQGKLTVHPLLFADVVIIASLTLIDIFLYKNRKLQLRICDANIVLCVAWYGYYAFMAFDGLKELGDFSMSFAVCLPLVAIVLFILAHFGIKADEDLIKSMDRIR